MARTLCRVRACLSRPPGTPPTGHFFTKTASRSLASAGGSPKQSLFQAPSMRRRSPANMASPLPVTRAPPAIPEVRPFVRTVPRPGLPSLLSASLPLKSIRVRRRQSGGQLDLPLVLMSKRETIKREVAKLRNAIAHIVR